MKSLIETGNGNGSNFIMSDGPECRFGNGSKLGFQEVKRKEVPQYRRVSLTIR